MKGGDHISNDKYIHLAARGFYYALCVAAVWLIFKYAVGLLAAVLVLLAVSSSVNCGAKRLSKLTRLPKRLCVFILLCTIVFLACFSVFFISLRLSAELEAVALRVSQNRGVIILKIENLLVGAEKFMGDLNILGEGTAASGYLSELVPTLINKVLSACLGAVGKPVTAIVGAAPGMLLGGIIFLLSLVWLSLDMDRIEAEAVALLPKSISSSLMRFKHRLKNTARQYLRAYILIFLLTLAEVYVGLLALRVPYSLLISLVVAAVDILPVFGAGAMLVPWAVLSLLMGNTSLGIGLFILYGVITVVRQIAEPYIVGQRLGVHPFISLAAMFCGFMLFGALGGLLMPFFLALIVDARRNR